jgi:DNA-binding XRE family transcriptional regulator
MLTAWAGAGALIAPRGAVRPVSEAIHNRIALVRAERGVTRRDLADAVGVHYQTIGYLERGEYNPSLYLALRIAAFFDLPVKVTFSIGPFPCINDVRDTA